MNTIIRTVIIGIVAAGQVACTSTHMSTSDPSRLDYLLRNDRLKAHLQTRRTELSNLQYQLGELNDSLVEVLSRAERARLEEESALSHERGTRATMNTKRQEHASVRRQADDLLQNVMTAESQYQTLAANNPRTLEQVREDGEKIDELKREIKILEKQRSGLAVAIDRSVTTKVRRTERYERGLRD